VITSDHALKLETVPDWIAIVGSGYIGLEFSDVYTALGSEVYFSAALFFSPFSVVFFTLGCLKVFFLYYFIVCKR